MSKFRVIMMAAAISAMNLTVADAQSVDQSPDLEALFASCAGVEGAEGAECKLAVLEKAGLSPEVVADVIAEIVATTQVSPESLGRIVAKSILVAKKSGVSNSIFKQKLEGPLVAITSNSPVLAALVSTVASSGLDSVSDEVLVQASAS